MGRQSSLRSLRRRIRRAGASVVTLDCRFDPDGRSERRSIKLAQRPRPASRSGLVLARLEWEANEARKAEAARLRDEHEAWLLAQGVTGSRG